MDLLLILSTVVVSISIPWQCCTFLVGRRMTWVKSWMSSSCVLTLFLSLSYFFFFFFWQFNSWSFAAPCVVKPKTNKPKGLFAAFGAALHFTGKHEGKAKIMIFRGIKPLSFEGIWSILISVTLLIKTQTRTKSLHWKHVGKLQEEQPKVFAPFPAVLHRKVVCCKCEALLPDIQKSGKLCSNAQGAWARVVKMPACTSWVTVFIFGDTETTTVKPTEIQHAFI